MSQISSSLTEVIPMSVGDSSHHVGTCKSNNWRNNATAEIFSPEKIKPTKPQNNSVICLCYYMEVCDGTELRVYNSTCGSAVRLV